ncbi:uncharacterized protein LOC129237526 [Anastrepha obliqua]|uniref:uncharacterized protein LOC129237526 n=1 Tax=Anastrepha obliqua TaxID=95512 RepID=UPI002409A0F2|nr:uncharacterized protein LOC129237526 [Anastrepha obliqua]
MVIQQIRTLLLSIVKLLRRMMCCFSFGRRRKPSCSEPIEIRVVVDGGKETLPAGMQSPSWTPQQQHVERDWNSWDDSPRNVTEHIEQYRQRLAKPPTPPPAEQEQDFFTELAPVIKPQLKYYLGNDNNDKTDFSRLEAKSDVPITMNADLEDWVDDSIDGGWDELDTEQTKQLIREKRREMRQQRQQKNVKTTGIEATKLRQSRT